MANSTDPISSGSMYLLQEEQIKTLEANAFGGDMPAAHRLLSYYRFSALDNIKANFWLKKIAESHDPASQYGLAKVYVDMKDYPNAKYWAHEAQKNGLVIAEKLLAEIDSLINPQDQDNK